jgi:hypothetical protein
MPILDAAQAACLSSDFLRSWRSYPNLILSIDSLGIEEDDATEMDEIQRDFISRVEHILQNHSGIGVKKFSLETYPCSSLHPSYVIVGFKLLLHPGLKNLNFQCSETESTASHVFYLVDGEALYNHLFSVNVLFTLLHKLVA